MQLRIERRWAHAWRLAVRRLGDARPAGGLLCEAGCLRQLRFEPDGFRVERRTPTLQLEQHGLGGLPDEPELAATRVVPEALGRDRRCGDVQQRVDGDDRILGDDLLRRSAGEDGQAAESGRARPLEEREPDGGVVREHGRRASAQCSSDRSLGARLDVERGEGEPGAVLGQSASSGRKALLLGERLIERSNPLTDELDPLIQRDPLALGAPGSLGCLDRLESRDVRRRSAQR